MTPFFLPAQLVERIGWTLIHSLWQFSMAALVAIPLLWLLRDSTARVRYLALLTLLLFSTSMPVATLCLSRSYGAGDDQHLLIVGGESVPSADVSHVVSGSNAGEVPLEPATVSWSEPSEATRFTPEDHNRSYHGLIQTWIPSLVFLWMCGLAIMTGRELLCLVTVRRLRKVGVSAVSKEIQGLMERACLRLKLPSAIRIAQSSLVKVPAVVGYFRPLVLLPVSMIGGIPMPQLEAIIVHELAHIVRHDYVFNFIQTIVETVFFYHPAIWWLSKQIRYERECCCDDIALKSIGSVTIYGRALLAVEELCGRNTAMALGANGSPLKQRIQRLTRQPSSHHHSYLPSAVSGLALLTALFVVTFNLQTVQQPTLEASSEPVKTEAAQQLSSNRGTIVTSSGAPLTKSIRLHQTHQGYPNGRHLSFWDSDAQGEIDFTDVEHGHYTFVVRPDESDATLLDVEFPLKAGTERFRLRSAPNASGNREEPQLRIRTAIVKRAGDHLIRIEVQNLLNEPYSLSNQDVRLRSERYCVFPPASAGVARVLPAKSMTTIELSWIELVERGVWVDLISEPIDPKSTVSKLQQGQVSTQLQLASIKAKIAQTEYNKAIRANRVLPGTVSDEEVARLKRAYAIAESLRLKGAAEVEKSLLLKSLYVVRLGQLESDQIELDNPMKVLANQAQARKTSTPDATNITVNYNIQGAEEEGRIFVQQIGTDRIIGTVGTDLMKWSPLKNGQTLELKDIGPGKYQVARYRQVDAAKAGLGRMSLGIMLDRRQFTLETGETATVNFTRPKGRQLTGQVSRLKELGLDSAIVYVCSEGAYNPDSVRDLNITVFDARTCRSDGTFQTEALTPGSYVLHVQGYEPPTGLASGTPRPRYLAVQTVTIPGDGQLQPVQIGLLDTSNETDRFRLNLTTSVRLTVMDSSGKKGLAQFRVIPGHRLPGEESPEWLVDLARPGENGNLFWPLDQLDDREWAFKVEAEGFESQTWTWVKRVEGPKHIVFMLAPKSKPSDKKP